MVVVYEKGFNTIINQGYNHHIIIHLLSITRIFLSWTNRSSQMQEDQRKDLPEKWQILGLSFVMMSQTPEDYHDLFKQEFGCKLDGRGWIKEVQYQ
jgi:hypothetical protein